MRSKTLLIAAAALVAGVMSSEAQVYSQNVVGYINQPIPANSYQIIGSQLINGSDVNLTNGDVNATLVTGMISATIPVNANPALVGTNSQMLYWGGSSYATYYYFNSNDASTWFGDPPGTDPAGWYDKLQNYAALNLNNGHATFIYNHSGIPLTITTTGNVFQGTNVTVTTINPGYNLVNLVAPVSTNVVVDASGNFIAYGLPSTLHSSNPGVNAPPTITSNDSILFWGGSSFATYYFFVSNDASAWFGDPPGTDPAGFYDKLQNPMPVNPSVNQGFFLYHNGTALNWTNTFNVQ